MSAQGGPDDGRTLAVLLAHGRGAGLHELTDDGPPAALFLAGRRRIVDFAMADLVAVGLPRVLVAVPHRPETLLAHLDRRWGGRTVITPCDGRRDTGRIDGVRGTVDIIAQALAEGEADAQPGAPLREVVVLRGCEPARLDLSALIGAHRAGGAAATVARAGDGSPMGACVLDVGWLRGALGELLAQGEGDLWRDLPPLAARDSGLLEWRDASARRLGVGTLDAYREAWLALTAVDAPGAAPWPLPAEDEGQPPEPPEARNLAFEADGVMLSAPRFGARRVGRWSVVEDSVLMPGARLSAGVRLSRAIVAPGAILPAGLVVGEDAAEDARWFRTAPGGTTLVTPPMLARRAAERMRQQFSGHRLAGLASFPADPLDAPLDAPGRH